MNDVIRYAKQIKFQIQHVISTQSLCTIIATHCKPISLVTRIQRVTLLPISIMTGVHAPDERKFNYAVEQVDAPLEDNSDQQPLQRTSFYGCPIY